MRRIDRALLLAAVDERPDERVAATRRWRDCRRSTSAASGLRSCGPRAQRDADGAASWPAPASAAAPARPLTVTLPVTPRSTPNSASSRLFWPWPSRPPRPTISPAPTSSEMPSRRLLPAEVLDLQRRRRARPRRLRRILRRDVAADHQLDDLAGRARALVEGLDVAAVAEHRGAVGQRLDLVHAVRDVEDRDALRLQTRQQGVDLLDVGARSARRSPRRGSAAAASGRAPWRFRPSAGATAAGRAPAAAD